MSMTILPNNLVQNFKKHCSTCVYCVFTCISRLFSLQVTECTVSPLKPYLGSAPDATQHHQTRGADVSWVESMYTVYENISPICWLTEC